MVTVAILFATWWSAATAELQWIKVPTTLAKCEAVQRATAQADVPGELWIKVECLPVEQPSEGV